MTPDPPGYIGEEMFEWDGAGYHFPAPPPAHLSGPDAIRADNPWDVLAAVLLRAQRGQFDALTILLGKIREANEYRFGASCFELLGDAGSVPVLEATLGYFHDELFVADNPDFQVLVGSALRQSQLLWAVPRLLEIYLRSTDREETGILTVYLSRILEPTLGPIACGEPPDPEYRSLVLGRYDELVGTIRTDRVPVYFGRPFSVPDLAKRLRDRLGDPDADEILIVEERHLFEAATGIDCRPFWEGGELRRLTAAAIVEEFLESPDAARYEDGVRYFFGHRIPD